MDVSEQAEEMGLDPNDYFSEEEFLEEMRARQSAREAPARQKPAVRSNLALARSLSTGRRASVINALRKGFPDARLTLVARISMDPLDGAGEKCAYVLEHVRNGDGKWVLAYTSGAAAEKNAPGVCNVIQSRPANKSQEEISKNSRPKKDMLTRATEQSKN